MLRSFARGRRRVLAILGSVSVAVVLAVALTGPSVVVGQATRTWVSGVGDDANPCSRTAPCKTFAGAISKTAAGGEISVLDPGGFGAVTITKAISIVSDQSGEGGILAAGTNGIIVNAAATDIVNIEGLNIEGARTGVNGIRFLAGAALHVSNSVIRNFQGGGAGNENGILFAPGAASELTVTNTIIEDNGVASVGAGILVKPTGTGGATVSLSNVRLVNNNIGLLADGSGGSGAINIDVQGTTADQNAFHGFSVVTTTTAIQLMIDSSSASQNTGGSGILCNGAGCTARVGRSSITGNSAGTSPVNGGVIQSYQTNEIRGNTSDGTRTNITGE